MPYGGDSRPFRVTIFLSVQPTNPDRSKEENKMRINKAEKTLLNDLLFAAYSSVALQLDVTNEMDRKVTGALARELQNIRDLVNGAK